MTLIWWIRRDLRLADNPALQAALAAARQAGADLLPLFILDPALMCRPAIPRQGFLFAGLRRLDASLRTRGSRLVVRAGDPLEVLARLAQEIPIGGIFAAEDYSPYARRRDARAAACLPLQLFPGVTVRHPLAVLKPDGSPYTVFTPFKRTWMAQALPGEADLLPAQDHMPPCPDLPGDSLPDLPIPLDFPPGEDEAERRLAKFLGGPAAAYASERNRLDHDGTSALSPYLRFGMLSPRRAAAAAWSVRQSALDASLDPGGYDAWISELVWREFYTAILYHFPDVLKVAFNPALRSIPWRDAPEDLHAWQAGLTGFPVVDAAMRQLAQTGWMHNRGRMLAASFLVKDLLINWREGEAWFMRGLVDGDPAANNGGWQWTAGVGTDAAPYFRIFSPVLQGEKFDPSGAYVRRWVPELERLPAAWIHHPWDLPDGLGRTFGFQPGRDYPLPVVDRQMARSRTLAAYRRN